MALLVLQDVCVRGCRSPPREGQPSEQVAWARARGCGGQGGRGVHSPERQCGDVCEEGSYWQWAGVGDKAPIGAQNKRKDALVSKGNRCLQSKPCAASVTEGRLGRVSSTCEKAVKPALELCSHTKFK